MDVKKKCKDTKKYLICLCVQSIGNKSGTVNKDLEKITGMKIAETYS